MTRQKTYSAYGLENIPGFLLWQVSKLWQRKQREALKGLGISNVEFVLLANLELIAKQREYVTQAMLSEQTKVDVMSTSSVIRALENQKLVKRLAHPYDTRARYVAITESGKKIALKGVSLIKKLNHDFFKSLSRDERTLIALLQKLIMENDEIIDHERRINQRV